MSPRTLRVPLLAYDLLLAPGAAPAVTFLREAGANRITLLLKEFASLGLIRGPDGAPIAADGIHYVASAREIDLETPSLRAARSLGYDIDDDALEVALLAQRRMGAEVAVDPADEPPIDEPRAGLAPIAPTPIAPTVGEGLEDLP